MNWPVVSLGEVADTALGKMLDKGKSRGLPAVPYLRNVNVQWDRIDVSDLLTMEMADEDRDRFAVEAGDLLVCEGGEIGRCAIWQGRTEYIAYQKALHRVRPYASLDTRYLRYLLEHHAHSGLLTELSTGSTISHLPQQKLRQVPVPLPDIDEQHNIVEILEDHLSRLDAAEHYLEQSERRLRTLELSVLVDCCEGEEVPLSDVTMIQGGIQKQPKRTPRVNHYPFLRVANVGSGQLNLTDIHRVELFDDELDRLGLQCGDLLVVEGNGSPSQIGRAALWDGSIENAVHQNHLIRVRPGRDINPHYLAAIWNSPQNRRILTDISSSSSGLHTLSVSKLKRVKIPVPSLERQAELVAQVEAMREVAERAAMAVADSHKRARTLRRSLLAAAFSGRLTNKDGNPVPLEEELVPA